MCGPGLDSETREKFATLIPVLRPAIFRLGKPSLTRAILLSVGAFLFSLRLAGFPDVENLHGSHWQFLALLIAAWGMAETFRCLQSRWSFYHAGVMILLYTDVLILAGIVALIAFP